MPKRAAEAPLSSETYRVRPDTFTNYRSQVAKLLSQKERSTNHDQPVVTTRHSNSGIGAEMSNVKKEKLNVLLRQCVKNITPEVDEMQRRVCSMYLYLISQLENKCPSSGPEESGGESEDEIQLLLKSDPDLVKRKTSLHTNILLSELQNMQKQLEGLLDDVVTTCRPMGRAEKRGLMKSIKELPKGDHDRILEIVRDHCITSGEDFSDKVIVNLENSDNVMLWRLHYYVGAVNNARKLGL